MACSACVARGKTWEGSDPRCGFNADGDFVPDNWACATLQRLRALCEKKPSEEQQKAGWAVLSLAAHGCAVDLLCCDRHTGVLQWLCEIKDGAKPPSKRRLKPACAKLMLSWPGPGAVVCSVGEAIEAGALARREAMPSCEISSRRYLEATGGVATKA